MSADGRRAAPGTAAALGLPERLVERVGDGAPGPSQAQLLPVSIPALLPSAAEGPPVAITAPVPQGLAAASLTGLGEE